MKKLASFVAEHISDDVTRLILDRKKWPEVDMDMVVACIESRKKLKGKVQEWFDEQRLIFPFKLSAEQCSSSATGRYKAELAARIAGKSVWNIADLTGGLGVDSWFFSQRAEKVLYNEMQKPLCDAAEYNFGILGAGNIRISNHAVTAESAKDQSCEVSASPTEILSGFEADIVYMDPARRGEGGKKVFLIEECTPDVLTLKDEIFSLSRHMLIKLSPMADITMLCERLGTCCREVHVVASGGECKELLIWMDREWSREYVITAVELHNDGSADSFCFRPSEERSSGSNILSGKQWLPLAPSQQAEPLPGGGKMPVPTICSPDNTIFEPGKALMKAGAFNMIAERFGIGKLAQSTHYYICNDPEKAEELKKYGKLFRILDCQPLDKRSIKQAGKTYPNAEVTARNIPMDTDTLRKKLGVSSGNDIHIFGLKADSIGNLLFVTTRI